MKLSEPFQKEELKNSVLALKKNIENELLKMQNDIFFAKPETGWSVAENIQHIIKVTRLLTLTFSTPKFLASLVFGEVGIPARSITLIGRIYLDELKKGQNSGPFTPSEESPKGDLEKRKLELFKDWNKSWDKFSMAIENWSEEQLDKILMPHPFLGKIPAREMYMIGMLHPIHHLEIVSKRTGINFIYF